MNYDFEGNRDKLFDGFAKPIVTGLFEELYDHRTDGKFVLFKLADWKKTYLEMRDPTEYKTAMRLIGNWEHWHKMLKNPKFKAHVEKWREELKVLLEAEAIQSIREQAKAGNVNAAKFMAKHEYKDTAPKRGPGRPKVEADPEEEAEKESKEAAAIMERLGIKIIAGGK